MRPERPSAAERSMLWVFNFHLMCVAIVLYQAGLAPIVPDTDE